RTAPATSASRTASGWRAGRSAVPSAVSAPAEAAPCARVPARLEPRKCWSSAASLVWRASVQTFIRAYNSARKLSGQDPRTRSRLTGVGHREDLLAAARRLLEDKGYAHITARD